MDFSGELDVPLFDQVVSAFYGGAANAAERKEAETVLNQFQEHPDSWMRVPPILQAAQNPQSKFLALTVLDKLIRSRWKMLPEEQRLGIRNFVVLMCLEWSSATGVQRSLLNKADLTLVQILKQEWPQNWPDFIPELVMSSRSSLEVCQNIMAILRLLSEEVFTYGDEDMTQAKAGRLKVQLSSEFGKIFELCHEVLDQAQEPNLIVATLSCLQRYLSWVPLAYIFETDILEQLVTKFLVPEASRNATLKCLTEVASLATPQHEQLLLQAFAASLEQLATIIPLDTDFKQAYAAADTNDQDFIQNLSLYLSAFMSTHISALEKPEFSGSLLLTAHQYLISISEIEEREVFKGCLDYWSRLVLDLFNEIRNVVAHERNDTVREYLSSAVGGRGSSSRGAASPNIWSQYPLRMHMYAPILSQLRRIIIEHMVRPEEVLVSENEDGEIVRVTYKESDTITLYKSLRDVLVYLTHLDVHDTRNIMLSKLDRQTDGSEWSWHNINTLCWAIGSISGAMDFQLEKYFLSTVLSELLKLTEKKRGKDNKAVVASNIMYIIGQYPRYLRAHWKFLKTVVNKLFEFMHETHEGVQDMACDTFITIADKCKIHFVEHKPEDVEPFINEIIADIELHTSELEPHQVQLFYEACGKILTAQTAPQTLEHQLEALMRLPNLAWTNLMESIKSDPSQLSQQTEGVKILVNVIRTNTSVCSSLGTRFESQLARIYADLMALYQLVSQQIFQDAAASDQFLVTHRSRLLRSVKREIFRLLETYLKLAPTDGQVVQEMAPTLLSTTLEDYRTVAPPLREYEVLSCVSVVVEKIGDKPQNADMVLGILENVFESTLSMIAGDMTDYPEFRVEFFKLLRTINRHCFPVLLRLPNVIFAQTISACLWAAKHDNRDVEDVGLSLILEICRNVAKIQDSTIVNSFFQQFARLILGDVFGVLTDPDHRSGFALQAQILSLFVQLVDQNAITAPLYPEGDAAVGTPNNTYLRAYLARSLKNAFPHLQDAQLSTFVEGMFQLYSDHRAFVAHLRDFLVSIKEFGGDDSWLYADEKAQQFLEQQRQQRERDLQVGGLVKPKEIDDDAI